MRRIFGVDFSGSTHAGRKIWIATGVVDQDTLRIEECLRGEDLPNSSHELARCLAALRDFIAASSESIFGLDFPFGLPLGVISDRSWEQFARSFIDRYSSPQQFRRKCFHAAHGHELKRVTDVESRTPFSPYNLRLYRQTYFGLCHVIRPLIADQLACVLPMQRPRSNKPWLIEICPASTLKRLNLYIAYKGKTIGHRRARARILRSIQRYEPLKLSLTIRSVALDDSEGDALDSVIAALATFHALRDANHAALKRKTVYSIEGYVYT